jgi:hypothetical protein
MGAPGLGYFPDSFSLPSHVAGWPVHAGGVRRGTAPPDVLLPALTRSSTERAAIRSAERMSVWPSAGDVAPWRCTRFRVAYEDSHAPRLLRPVRRQSEVQVSGRRSVSLVAPGIAPAEPSHAARKKGAATPVRTGSRCGKSGCIALASGVDSLSRR